MSPLVTLDGTNRQDHATGPGQRSRRSRRCQHHGGTNLDHALGGDARMVVAGRLGCPKSQNPPINPGAGPRRPSGRRGPLGWQGGAGKKSSAARPQRRHGVQSQRAPGVDHIRALRAQFARQSKEGEQIEGPAASAESGDRDAYRGAEASTQGVGPPRMQTWTAWPTRCWAAASSTNWREGPVGSRQSIKCKTVGTALPVAWVKKRFTTRSNGRFLRSKVKRSRQESARRGTADDGIRRCSPTRSRPRRRRGSRSRTVVRLERLLLPSQFA